MRVGWNWKIPLKVIALLIPFILLSVSVHALTDIDPPVVRAYISEDQINIEAYDSGSGIEAIYVNDIRVNYRVDGIIKIPLSNYTGDIKEISVYAIDFSGNTSEILKLDNPYYTEPQMQETTHETVTQIIPDENDPEEENTSENDVIQEPQLVEVPETAVPTEDLESEAFTPNGTGTVVDNITEQNGKEFFTVTTDAGNIFYLIIDRYRESENVYLLNSVTEEDLMSLAENPVEKSESAIPAAAVPESKSTEETDNPDIIEQEKNDEIESAENDDDKSNNNMIIFIGIGAAAVLGVGVYIKVILPKRQKSDTEPDSEDNTYEDNVYEDDDIYDEDYDDEESEEDE